MSVIGRLDDQVEAVLINPLKRREQSDGEEERDAPTLPPPAASYEERDEQTPVERRESGGETLPVWML